MNDGGVRADFHDGLSSRPREVTLRFLPGGRLLIEGAEARETSGAESVPTAVAPLEFSRAQVRIESRLGDAPRFVRLPGDRRCEVRDNDALDAALGAWSASGGPGGASWLHRIERSWRLVIVSVVVLLAVGWAAFRYGVPWGAKQVAFMLPESLTTKLGDETMAVFDRTLFDESKLPAARRDELRAVFARFLRAAGEREDYRIEFRHAAIGANAFALPSGVIVITDDLVELAENDDEILGVLAHECAHVKHRHVLRGVLQNATVAVVVTLVTGDVSATAAAAGAAPAFLLQSAFSQEFEREADAEAVRAMRRAGKEPGHLATMLERLEDAHGLRKEREAKAAADEEDKGGVLDYIGSHPPTRERLKAIREGAAAGDADEAGTGAEKTE